MSDVELVVRCGDRLGESPVWDGRAGRLWWVDSRGPALQSCEADGSGWSRSSLPEVVGSVALRESGGFVAAMKTGIYTLDPDTGDISLLASPEQDHPQNRFNDGRCDRAGRFWAGTMSDVSRDPVGALYRLDGAGSCRRMLEDVIVPNSLAWSPDSSVMYFADTYRHHILAYDFDSDEGRMSNERLFRDTRDQPGRPDGSAVDEDGCLWNAEYAGARVVRYRPDGSVDCVVEVPVSNPTCVTFGGSRLDTMYITTASQRLSPAQLAREPLAGALFACVPGVRGIEEPRFQG